MGREGPEQSHCRSFKEGFLEEEMGKKEAHSRGKEDGGGSNGALEYPADAGQESTASQRRIHIQE